MTSSPSPSPASISSRLTTTSSLLLERSRIISLNLKPSPSSQVQIVRNLSAIRADLDLLALEGKGLTVGGRGRGGAGKGKDGGGGEGSVQVLALGERYDRLLEMLAEDEVGREKAKSLRREVRRSPTPPPVQPAESSFPIAPSPSSSSSSSSSLTLPQLNVEPPTPGGSYERFRDYPDDVAREEEGIDSTGHGDPRDMLSNQQELMDDQDQRLNLLSHSIGRQNHLSIQIGSELDLHHQLLEDTDAAMDRTSASLGRARRRLDKVAKDAKQYGSTITIVALIFILLILIIVFKT